MAGTCSARRGSIYVLVLIAMAIAGMVVLVSLELANSRNTAAALVTNNMQARQYAHSAIEYGLAIMAREPTWRWTRGDGYWQKDARGSRGTFDLQVTGAHGSAIAQNAWEPATLIGAGRVHDSRSLRSVQIGLQGEGVPIVGDVIFQNTGLAIWPLEGDVSTIRDEQIQGNSAVLVDGSSPFRAGVVPGLGAATAAWFSDGSHITMGLANGYERIRTVSFWFWAESTAVLQGVINRDALGMSKGSWACTISSGQLNVYVESGWGFASLSTPITSRQWNHVVFTFENARCILYLNGAQVDAASSLSSDFWDASSNTEKLYVGASHSFSFPGSSEVFFPFTGSIAHVVLMGEPLGKHDVEALYQGYPAPAQYKILADTWNRESD